MKIALTTAAEDDLAWLASAGTDATDNITKPAAAVPLQLNSEESSLIAKLLGQKAEDDDDANDTGKRYFVQDSKASEPKVEKKEVEDITAQLVYDDENDELESFLQEKKKNPKPSTAPPSASSASSASPSLPSQPEAPISVSQASSSRPAPVPPGAEPKEDKKAKSKSNFKF